MPPTPHLPPPPQGGGGKTIDPRSGGVGDLAVGLWIAEGARTRGEEIPFVADDRGEIVRAFGHRTVVEATTDCLRLGSGHDPYENELRSSDDDRSTRVHRWQREVGWEFGGARPTLGPLPPESEAWADALVADGPLVVIAPKAGYDSRSLPLQKWLRVAWALQAEGVRTVAIDGHGHVVREFPFYVFGFGWPHILALLARARVVAANDSGISHLAATIGVPTVTAMGPTAPEIVFGHARDALVPVRTADVPCVGCHFSREKGFNALCDAGCDALHMLPWPALRDEILRAYRAGDSLREAA